MNPFNTAFLKAPKRSRFDFSHTNTVGVSFGALTPTLSQFIVPGDEVSLSMEQICRLAPMPVPTFTPIKVRHDFFFVPLRLLYGVEYMDKLFGSDVSTLARANCQSLEYLHNVFASFGWDPQQAGSLTVAHTKGAPFIAGTLFDFLGFPVWTDQRGALSSSMLANLANNDLNAFAATVGEVPVTGNTLFGGSNNSGPVIVEKFFAYHFIWRDWYRFTGVQDNSIVEPFLSNGILSEWNNSQLDTAAPTAANVAVSSSSRRAAYVNESQNNKLFLGDLSQLKYAHLTKDMFTSVRYGNKPTVLIPTGSSGTIPALREASAVQRFIDIISITGQRYFDKMKGLFGVEPDGPKNDRVQFLARYQQFIKVGEVITTATTQDATTGDYAGRGILIDGKYLFKRRFTEHGYLFCITSVIPDVAYNGLSRDLTDIFPIDTPVPSLAEVGDQSVLAKELSYTYDISGRQNLSIGDQFRYYFYKSAHNQVHGFFLMETARPWSPLYSIGLNNIISGSRVLPTTWNYMFNDTANEWLYGDRFFFNLDFTEYISRSLPKYINYHL